MHAMIILETEVYRFSKTVFWESRLILHVQFKCAMQIIKHAPPNKRRRSRSQAPPTFVAEPITQSNSFVGTEEYIAPVW